MTVAPIPYARPRAGVHPPNAFPDYKSTSRRAPRRASFRFEHTLSEVTGPTFDDGWAGPDRIDLTRPFPGGGEAQGQRIIVSGCVLDGNGAAVRRTLVEVWQCNAAGRYVHVRDQHDAPLDPNFVGVGRMVTNDDGEYRFLTIEPGAYPWRNSDNAWRPKHIHFSVFGPAFATRLITQMYFPGDPLLAYDPIFNGIADEAVRGRLVAGYDPTLSEAEYALGFRFDIVLRGRAATPAEGRDTHGAPT